MFQDEARFGRISDTRRCWCPKPIRPLCYAMVTQEYTRTIQLAFRRRFDPVANGLVAQPEFLANHADALAVLDPLTANSLNSIVYACFGIFISCLPKVTRF